MNRYFVRAISIALFLFCYQISFSQVEHFTSQLDSTKTGVLLNFNSSSHFFSLIVDGKKIQTLPDNGEQKYLSVDGKVLQYLLVPFPKKMDYSALDEKKKQSFLLDYEGYEMEYIKSSLKEKNLNEKLHYENLNGTLFLFWVFDMPKKYKVRQQCYLVTVCFDHMLVLNSPVEGNMADTKDFLIKIGTSLKTGNK